MDAAGENNILASSYSRHANKFAEYEDLRLKGKLVILPCAVGDIVYAISHDHIIELVVTGVCITCIDEENVIQIVCKNNEDEEDYSKYHYMEKHIGDMIFLKEEDARQALKNNYRN